MFGRVYLVGLLVVGGCFTFDPDPGPQGGDRADAGTVSGDAADPTDEAPRRMFVEKVHPILSELCASCHSPDGPDTTLPFYRTKPDIAYTTLLEQFPDLLGVPAFSPEAPLVTAPQRTGQVGYSAEQVNTIHEWFALETR